MTWRIMNCLAVAGLLLGGTQLVAHERFQIDGAIVRFEERSLVVKSRTGESFTFQLQKSTVVRREKERVPQTELLRGRDVAVSIMADSLHDENPFVLSVTLTPPATGPKAN
jgi:hypothetical protein